MFRYQMLPNVRHLNTPPANINQSVAVNYYMFTRGASGLEHNRSFDPKIFTLDPKIFTLEP